jgi:hypothetical protein
MQDTVLLAAAFLAPSTADGTINTGGRKEVKEEKEEGRKDERMGLFF